MDYKINETPNSVRYLLIIIFGLPLVHFLFLGLRVIFGYVVLSTNHVENFLSGFAFILLSLYVGYIGYKAFFKNEVRKAENELSYNEILKPEFELQIKDVYVGNLSNLKKNQITSGVTSSITDSVKKVGSDVILGLGRLIVFVFKNDEMKYLFIDYIEVRHPSFSINKYLTKLSETGVNVKMID